jgi:hypothetical protein
MRIVVKIVGNLRVRKERENLLEEIICTGLPPLAHNIVPVTHIFNQSSEENFCNLPTKQALFYNDAVSDAARELN